VRDRTADARLADLASRIVSLEAEGAALRARARVLEAFATLRAASSPPSSSSGDDGGGGGEATRATPSGDPLPERHAEAGAAPASPSPSGPAGDPPLDWAAVAPLWASITAGLRAALPLAASAAAAGGTAGAGGPTPTPAAAAAAGEVATLVQEASALLASVALVESEAYGGFGKGASPPATAAAGCLSPPPLHLADAIGLTPPQRAALIEARRGYLASMATLQAGRASIAAALHGLPEPVPWTGAPASRAFLHIAGAVEALGRHVRAGRIAAATFTGAAWRDVLTPAQAGALILLTAPARPCLYVLARALAVEAGVDDDDGGAGMVAAAAAAAGVGPVAPGEEEVERPRPASSSSPAAMG
jgi:hypothetical protein